jgi:hypothetical protein
MRLNKAEIEQELEVLNMRLGLGQYADKFPAYALLERFISSLYTMNPMGQGEMWILYKEAYGYCPKAILDIYTDFVSTLPTDIEVSIAKKEDELYFEVEGETVAIEI